MTWLLGLVMIAVGALVAWMRRRPARVAVEAAAREADAVRAADAKHEAARKAGTLKFVNERFGRR